MKQDNYQSDVLDDTEKLDYRMKRLAKEVRLHVKYIQNYTIFSQGN
jgi:hypothetical protein